MPGFPSHHGRLWAYLGFLLLFFFLLLLVSDWYLLPAMQEFNQAGPAGRQILSVHALLLMSVLLVLLVLCLILIFRIGRFLFPNPTGPRSKTKYTDAWAESGKRMRTPKE